MPARLTPLINDQFYHIYNRGVEKRLIFQDAQDYAVFLSYLKTYLLPKNEKELRDRLSNPNINYKERDEILRLLRLNNFADQITLLAYCLMPNHFHFLVKQVSADSIDRFVNSLGTRYTMYFNKKYRRVGSLYQGVYKAVLVNSDEQLLHLTNYIHRNPIKNSPLTKLGSKGEAFRAKFFVKLTKQPSSYPEYLGQRNTEWIHTKEILSFFSKTNPTLSYQSFVETEPNFNLIKNMAIDF